MVGLYTQLRDLGCADFTKGAKPIILPCNTEDADSLVLLAKIGSTVVHSCASFVQVKEIEAQLLQWKGERLKLCDLNDWMLFFHTPKLLLLYKEVNGWTSLLLLCDSKSLQDMTEKIQLMNHFIESEAKLIALRHELLALSLLQSCSLDEWTQFLEKVLQVCTELSGRAVRHIVKEISFLCENNLRAFDYRMKKVEVS